MKNVDVELIQRVLNGDDTAFSALVKKYQKSVHALVWRKIGDFHIAEDITQETFLKAYQKLSALKEPQSFASWLYVIAANRCNAWLRKKRLRTQSLEDTSSAEFEKATYSNYVIAENERATAEAQREVVKKLLSKLQESDRTVITLYYLGGMTYEEISRFLGVSVSAIKNRLYRARQHLKKEEPLIREALENYQITPHLTDNIMREIGRLKPAAPSGSKPLVPWAVAVSSLVLIVLMLGIGSQRLVRFQQPYNLDAQSEMTVELVDAPIVLNLEEKSDVRRQFGNLNALGKSDNRGEKPDDELLAAAQVEGEDVAVTKQQWIQSKPLAGSSVQSFLATPEGDLYTHARGDIFKLPANGDRWQHVFDISTLNHSGLGDRILLKKWNNVLYYTQSSDLFTSKDDGKTWEKLFSWDNTKYYYSIDLILTKQAFYMAFENGIFRSEDSGNTWKEISERLPAQIRSLAEVQNTLFAGTDNGFYRLDSDGWKRLEFPESIEMVYSVAMDRERVYILAKLDYSHPDKVSRGLERGWGVFRSSDLGNSWEDITPTNAWTVKGFIPDAKLIAVGETLLLMEKGMVRSTDGGNTWMPPQLPGTSPEMYSIDPAVVVNKDTIYVGSNNGLHRSTDGGKSWDIINITPDESGIDNLIAFKRTDERQNRFLTLYAKFGSSIVKTTDKGKSWKNVQVDIPMSEPHKEESPLVTHIVKSNGVIYAKGGDSLINYGDSYGRIKTLLYRVSTDDNTLVPVQGMPFFDSGPLKDQLSEKRGPFFDSSNKEYVKQLQEGAHGATQFFEQLAKWDPLQPDEYMQLGFRTGPFAVSNDTFYMEYNFKLFRWEPGYTEWQDTGQEETVELSLYMARDLKLAASGNTVYVGKRDGHLVVSFDKGNNWFDITPGLPFTVKTFNEIVVAGSTVYVATDAGIITSDDGRHWHTITDAEGKNLIMEHLAVDGTTVYGVTENTGAYRLKSGIWVQIVAEIPDNVTSLAVDGDTLYVGTENRGMLHFNLEK